MIIGTIIVIVLGILAAALGTSSKKVSTDLPVAFVDAVKTGKYADAYNMLSPELMEQQSIKQFTAQFSAGGVLLDETCTPSDIESKQVDNEQQHFGLIRCKDKSYRAQFAFVDVDEEMKLVRYLVQPE